MRFSKGGVFVCDRCCVYLLGGLLLLLLLGTAVLGRGLGLGRCGSSLLGLLLLLLLAAAGDEESDHSLGLDEAVVVHLELAEDVVNLSLGELVAEVHQSVTEHLSLDLAIGLVSLEGANNEVVGIVGSAGHLVLEHVDHGVEGACAADLAEHVVELALGHELADVVEGGTDVVLGDGAVLVDVHQLEALLVHLKLLGREAALIALAHDGGEMSCLTSKTMSVLTLFKAWERATMAASP